MPNVASLGEDQRGMVGFDPRRRRRRRTTLLQLGRLAGLKMYGTCSARSGNVVSDQGGIPIDYHNQDFVKEVRRLTSDGVDA